MGKKQSIRSAVIGGLVGALVVMTLPAIGATLNQSVGDPLSLGNNNRIDERTDLKGKAKGANLQIKNTGNARALTAKADKIALLAKATSGPVAISATASRNAVKIKVDDGQAPIKVNPGAGTATNLSADLLDGMDSTEFLGADDKAADSELLDGLDSTQVRPLAATANSEGISPDTAGTVLTVDITVPTLGILLINGGFRLSNAGTAGTTQCEIEAGAAGGTIDNVDGTHRDVDNGADTGASVAFCHTSGHLSVTAGTWTVDLGAPNLATGADIDDASLEVLFIPRDLIVVVFPDHDCAAGDAACDDE